MKRSDLVPFKAVAEEVGYSRATIWRASQSGIPGFPPAIVNKRRVFWKKSDLPALEEALFHYQGRIAFERNRAAARKVAVIARAKAAAEPAKRTRAAPARPQRDLFGE